MHEHEFFEERRSALEEAFFRNQDEKVKARLRDKVTGEAHRAQLRAAGVNDEKVLEELVRQGITAGTMAAIHLVPLVAVAWADGKVQESERTAILAAAEKSGVAKGTDAHALLDTWLTRQPESALVAAWRDFVRSIAGSMPGDSRDLFRAQVMSQANAVAKASGGVLGFGSSVSLSEKRVLAELEAALA